MIERTGTLHHVEIWVPDLARTAVSWGWLLGELGYTVHQEWPRGVSWLRGITYLVFEQSPALTGTVHDRCAPGLNHLAFHVGSRPQLDRIAAEAHGFGWSTRVDLRAEADPYAIHLIDEDGYEAELVAP